MNDKYIIVLFKNRKKRKIIKRYGTEKRAKLFFDSLLKKQEFIIFPKILENAEESNFMIGLLTNTTNVQNSLFVKDEYGRNIPANIESSDYVFISISNYKQEEKIFDWQKNKKISFDDLIKIYCKTKELKSIYTLNNKLCIQIQEDVFLFSLKDKNDSVRLLDTIQEFFMSIKRFDAIFVKDISTAQRKWIYNILEEKGFDKKRLYRTKTTFSKR
jgi:hypothetical protein